MSALERIRAAGFTVEMTLAGKVRVTGKITPDQRAWLAANRGRLAAELSTQAEPLAFDEAGYRAMKRDRATVLQDLAATGMKLGRIRAMFGLSAAELHRMIRP